MLRKRGRERIDVRGATLHCINQIQIYENDSWPNITGLDWSPDGRGLYCGSVSPQVNTVLYVDLKGNARVLWQTKGGGSYIWGVPSPDGRYLALLGDVTNSNVWMVEGF